MRLLPAGLAFLVLAAHAGSAQVPLTYPATSTTMLAQQWSGLSVPPTCHVRGPHGEYLDPHILERYCDWPTTSRGRVGVMVFEATSGAPQALITWTLPTNAARRAGQIADSLALQLTRAGLRRVECVEHTVPAGRSGGTLFENDTLVVHLSRVVPPNGEPARITVLATDSPRSFPRWTCDGSAPPSLSRRDATIHAPTAIQQRTAPQFIMSVYRDFSWETRDSGPQGTPLFAASPKVLRTYLDSSLVAAVMFDRACQRRAQGVCNLDFDPMWASQDPVRATVRVKATPDPAVVRAEVRYPGEARPRVITYRLRHTRAGWRITDLGSVDWPSLRKLLLEP